jgi:hypothetical protein
LKKQEAAPRVGTIDESTAQAEEAREADFQVTTSFDSTYAHTLLALSQSLPEWAESTKPF